MWRGDCVSALLETGRFHVLAADEHGQTALDWALGVHGRSQRTAVPAVGDVESDVVVELLAAAERERTSRGIHIANRMRLAVAAGGGLSRLTRSRYQWSLAADTVVRCLVSHPIHLTGRSEQPHRWVPTLLRTLAAHARVWEDAMIPHVLPAVLNAVAAGGWERRRAAVAACFL